jgi:hypothetical protein
MTEEQVSDDLDDPKDGRANSIAPYARQLALCDTSFTSSATTPGAVCDLRKPSRQNGPFKETDRTEVSATIKEQQGCVNLCVALLRQKLHS